MKSKGRWLFWTVAALFILVIGLTATGMILEWGLPHGGGGGGHRGGMGRARDATLLSIDRHAWGEIHFYIALAFVAVVVVHLLLHVGWIKTSIRRNLLGR